MGGNGSSSKKKSGGGGGKALTGQKAVDEVYKLKNGSEIEVTYDTGVKTVTDTFRKEKKYYSFAGSTATTWVNKTGNGWQNDFAPNKLTLQSVFLHDGTSVKVTKRR